MKPMHITDPKDIIKACGYVFIYAANLEYSLDSCYVHLKRLGSVDLGQGEISQDKYERKGFAKKIEIIKDFCFPKFDVSKNDIKQPYQEFKRLLDACHEAVSSHDFLLSRNQLGHRPLFSEGKIMRLT